MAVLEKRAGMQMNNSDAYVNIVGGIRVDEPACDLGVLVAIASSFKNKEVNDDTCLMGEVGLTGEVRAVSQIDKRVMEALRMGFKTCIIPAGNAKSIAQVSGIDIKLVENIYQVMDLLF
jgi:DNA repair protein RadA/Sms